MQWIACSVTGGDDSKSIGVVDGLMDSAWLKGKEILNGDEIGASAFHISIGFLGRKAGLTIPVPDDRPFFKFH